MSKVLELQKKADALEYKHQKDIDEKLKSDMREIFSDTKRTLSTKAESLKKSIDTVKQDISAHHSEATAQVLSKMEEDTKALKKSQATATKELIQLQSEQIKSLQAHLQASSHLSQEIANQANIKKSYQFDYSVGFSDAYLVYQQHLSRVREQKQVEPAPSPRSKATAGRSHSSAEDRSIQTSHNQLISRPEREEVANGHDLTSTTFNNYRRTTTAAEEATAGARRSLTAYTSTVSDHQRIEAIHSNFKNQAQRSCPSSEEISTNRAESRRTDTLRNFVTGFTNQVAITVRAKFDAVSEWAKHREPSPRETPSDFADLGATGDREADQATSSEHRSQISLGTAE